MMNSRITTESGAVYTIVDGFCRKTNRHGEMFAPFKVWTVKAVEDDVDTWVKLLSSPNTVPEVGKRLYVSGKDVWWLSSRVVYVDKEESIND